MSAQAFASEPRRGYNNGVWSVAFSPDGQTLANGCNDKTVRCWDASSGRCRQTLQGHPGQVRTDAFSPQVISWPVAVNRTVRCWDASTMPEKLAWTHQLDKVRRLQSG